METIKLVVEKREPGKKAVKATRNEGYLPVEIYGAGVESNISGKVLHKDMIKALHTPMGKNVVLDLDCDGKTLKAIPCDFQIHPVRNAIAHIDMYAVKEGQPVQVKVPVKREGKSQGEILGGRVFQVIKEINVSCLADVIPESIVVDLSPTKIGDRIKLSDINYPEGVTPVYVQDVPVFVVNKGRGQSTTSDEDGEEESTEE